MDFSNIYSSSLDGCAGLAEYTVWPPIAHIHHGLMHFRRTSVDHKSRHKLHKAWAQIYCPGQYNSHNMRQVVQYFLNKGTQVKPVG